LTATILDGKAIARQIQMEIAERTQAFLAEHGVTPALHVILVGADPASEVYVRQKQRACKRVGIASELHRLPPETTTGRLIELVLELNKDAAVHGILVQLPLPPQIHEQDVLDAVSPLKDVDCFHPENVGRLSQGRPRFLPCTPHGVQQLLDRCGIPAAGRHVVVVGRSEIVGKPTALLMMQRDSTRGPQAANATVTVCHSRTENLPDVTRTADILIVAMGRPQAVTAEMLRPGAVVVDVGIHRVADRLVGDVDFDAVKRVAGAITPVPGGVGPLTVAMLLENTLQAARLAV